MQTLKMTKQNMTLINRNLIQYMITISAGTKIRNRCDLYEFEKIFFF